MRRQNESWKSNSLKQIRSLMGALCREIRIGGSKYGFFVRNIADEGY